MAKIIHLFKDEEAESREALVAHIKDLLAAAEQGEIRSLLIAGEGAGNQEGLVVTGWVNMDHETRARMVVHHNMDLVKTMIDANYYD